jgi:hypothetical protein
MGPVKIIVVQMAQLMQRRMCGVTVVVIKHCVGCTVANNNFFTLICKVQVGIRKVR